MRPKLRLAVCLHLLLIDPQMDNIQGGRYEYDLADRRSPFEDSTSVSITRLSVERERLYVSLLARIRGTRVAESSEPLDLSERRSIESMTSAFKDFSKVGPLSSLAWTLTVSIISGDPDGKGR